VSAFRDIQFVKKQAFYTLVQQLREIEQQFTQFEWQLTRLEPEEFARQWGDNTRKFEAGDAEAKERDAVFRRAAKWCIEFHTYRAELERRRRRERAARDTL
jgi:hypothetical protein